MTREDVRRILDEAERATEECYDRPRPSSLLTLLWAALFACTALVAYRFIECVRLTQWE